MFDRAKHNKEYRTKNREKINARQKERYREVREQRLAYSRERRKNDSEYREKSIQRSRNYGKSLHGNYMQYKCNANARKLSFNIPFEYFCEIIFQDCFYCGRRGRNGIDRIDNLNGYEIDNITSCCIDCNRAKMCRSQEEYKNWIRKSYKNLFGEFV